MRSSNESSAASMSSLASLASAAQVAARRRRDRRRSRGSVRAPASARAPGPASSAARRLFEEAVGDLARRCGRRRWRCRRSASRSCTSALAPSWSARSSAASTPALENGVRPLRSMSFSSGSPRATPRRTRRRQYSGRPSAPMTPSNTRASPIRTFSGPAPAASAASSARRENFRVGRLDVAPAEAFEPGLHEFALGRRRGRETPGRDSR